MIKAGITSVTFREKTPEEIISLVKASGLEAIEWGSDIHVPAGDIKRAEEVRKMTLDAGLDIPSYGSYYRMGTGAEIEPFLQSAAALGASTVRIWTNGILKEKITPEIIELATEEARAMCRAAAKFGITLSTEYHEGTLTYSPESMMEFFKKVGEDNLRTYWQMLLDIPHDRQAGSAKAVYNSGKLTNFHVYWYTNGVQGLIRDGKEYWAQCFDSVKSSPETRYALIEFVKDGTVENFKEDAKALSELVRAANKN